MSVVVTGRTFDIRDRLKSLGGRWNADNKQWKFYTLSPELRDEFARTVGVVVADAPGDPVPRQRPQPRSIEISDFLEHLASRSDDETDGKYKTIVRGNDPTYFNYFADRNPQVFFGFSDLPSMMRYIEHIPINMQNGSGWETGTETFTGTDCIEQAFRLAIGGWPDGVKLAQFILEQLTGANAIQRKRKYSLSGGAVNVGRMLTGNPVHMISRPKQHGNKIVTLFISVTMNALIEVENAIIRAAAIAAVSDILEMNGYSCEIVAVDTYHDNSKPIGQIVVKLKDAGEALNISDAIFAMGHPSFLRRFCFALIGSERSLEDIWDGMGCDGIVFNDDTQPKANEFYFDHLTFQHQEKLDGLSDLEKAHTIIDLCTDETLPITLNRDM